MRIIFTKYSSYNYWSKTRKTLFRFLSLNLPRGELITEEENGRIMNMQLGGKKKTAMLLLQYDVKGCLNIYSSFEELQR